ncbi:MAG TPA: RsmB/NOP family class I SAM-dependent RNA methyltransferase [Stellaceae bacterium]|jgi:16S rRNA (cytosine967-C5)-methyltransferase|nr:RsmB/NOP family class I SAM-dependent RNA methyltransferase [Stellaceae bacterium]
MTPGARLEAAIGLLSAIGEGRGAADDIVADYFRRHRFAGAKDRAAISKHIYGVLRQRGAIDYWLTRCEETIDARRRLLAELALFEEWSLDQIDRACDGDRFRPVRLDDRERRLIETLSSAPAYPKDMPQEARGNFPRWLGPSLERSLGRDLAREMTAMQDEAGLDLRVNLLKAEREAVYVALSRQGIELAHTKLSPIGLRLFERVPLGTLDLFKNGSIEVQDEGSQIAALLADARPGMRVVDFCAGAGGKTLALAAQMKNRGHLVATDVAPKRLERATERLRRAGASIVQRQPLASQRDKWVKRHAQGFDRVFVDAPCTGTGTWRRNPDAKWRLKPEDVAELPVLQADILDSAQRLVKPGGRLIYATCSLLMEEDEDQVAKFIETHADFFLVPIRDIWADTVGGECPARNDTLRLSPARNGTDGFFVAVMERKPATKKENSAAAQDADEALGADAEDESTDG